MKDASASQTGPSQVEPVPVSPLRASVPSAESFWKVHSGIRHHLMTGLIYRETGKDPKGNGFSFAEVPDWQLRQWMHVMENAAKAMSARQGQDRNGLGATPASAVANGDLPNTQGLSTPLPSGSIER